MNNTESTMYYESEEVPFASSSTAPQIRPIIRHPDILRRVYYHGAQPQLVSVGVHVYHFPRSTFFTFLLDRTASPSVTQRITHAVAYSYRELSIPPLNLMLR